MVSNQNLLDPLNSGNGMDDPGAGDWKICVLSTVRRGEFHAPLLFPDCRLSQHHRK